MLAASVMLAGCPAIFGIGMDEMAASYQAELRAQENPDLDPAGLAQELIGLSTEPLSAQEKADVQAKLSAMTDDERLRVRSYLMVIDDMQISLEKSYIQRIANSKVPDGTDDLLFYQMLLTTSG